MALEQFVDLLAAVTTVSGTIMSAFYFLQAYKISRRKSVEDLSLGMFAVMFVGTFLWLLYGISLNNLPIIIANTVAVIGLGVILVLYFKYKKK